jgi:hypothetical protein
MSWGTLTVGGLTLKETYTISDATNAQSGVRTINLSGVETSPPMPLFMLQGVAEDLASMMGKIVPITFSHKTDRNGYYSIDDVNTTALMWVGEAASFNWSMGLSRIGPDNAVNVESRLANVVRSNSFGLVGERWHAPAIGHYGYHTGPTMPAPLNRVGEAGTVVVYRTLPAAVNPRWGCPVASFTGGRVRLLVSGAERFGIGIRAAGTGWELNNGLVKVVPGTNVLTISAFTGGAWQAKDWNVYLTNTVLVGSYDSMTVLRNDNEATTIRLVESISPGPGVAHVDLTLRRGSRFVEGYITRSNADELSVRLASAEAFTNSSANGFLVATANDAAGNRFVAGSAKTFTAHANGGVVKTATTSLDFWVGVEAGGTGAVAGDQAATLRNQYIAVQSEATAVIPR